MTAPTLWHQPLGASQVWVLLLLMMMKHRAVSGAGAPEAQHSIGSWVLLSL